MKTTKANKKPNQRPKPKSKPKKPQNSKTNKPNQTSKKTTKQNKQTNPTKDKNLFVLPSQGAILDLLVPLKHLFNQIFQINVKKIPNYCGKHDSLENQLSCVLEPD